MVLCFLAKTAPTFRHSFCQMNSFANSRNTCRQPSWPCLIVRFGNPGYQSKNLKARARDWVLLALYVHFLIWKEVCKERKWWQVPRRGITEALTQETNVCHLNIWCSILAIGVSGELSQPNDIITSRTGCCFSNQFPKYPVGGHSPFPGPVTWTCCLCPILLKYNFLIKKMTPFCFLFSLYIENLIH